MSASSAYLTTRAVRATPTNMVSEIAGGGECNWHIYRGVLHRRWGTAAFYASVFEGSSMSVSEQESKLLLVLLRIS